MEVKPEASLSTYYVTDEGLSRARLCARADGDIDLGTLSDAFHTTQRKKACAARFVLNTGLRLTLLTRRRVPSSQLIFPVGSMRIAA